jgi:hypothetical protein
MEVDVSNMNKNPNKKNVTKEPSANKLQVNLMRQKSQHEEFGSELHPGSAKLQPFAEKQRLTDDQQPVSERTAWN